MGRKRNKSVQKLQLYSDLYFTRLLELGMSMFEWKNLPLEIDERFLELNLLQYGCVSFFKDDILNEYLVTQCTLNGKLDIYNNPTSVHAFAPNGYQNELTNKNSVLIFNNYMHAPISFQLKIFAERLARLDMTIDININAQKVPFIIACAENQRLTCENMYEQIDDFRPVIIVDKNLDLSNVKVLNTNAQFTSGKLYEIRNNIWNDALNFLGVTNNDETKKERLLDGEIKNNMGSTTASRNTRLAMRQNACEQINAMFGLELEVAYREPEQNVIEIGGEYNEPLHE